MCTHTTSPANSLAAWSPIRFNLNCYAPSNMRLNTRHDLDHASQMNMLKTELGFSLSIYLHPPKAQTLPSGLKIFTTRETDPSSKALSLSLHLGNSCSNELNQTSDIAEDLDRGHDLLATKLSSLFIFFCSIRIIWTSSTSYAGSFSCSQKETEFPQLISCFPSLYTPSILDQLSLLL